MFTSSNVTKQFRFEYELALLIFLACLIGLVVFPADRLVALLAFDITNNVPTRCHVSLHSICLLDVDHCSEQESFAMLSTKVA